MVGVALLWFWLIAKGSQLCTLFFTDYFLQAFRHCIKLFLQAVGACDFNPTQLSFIYIALSQSKSVWGKESLFFVFFLLLQSSCSTYSINLHGPNILIHLSCVMCSLRKKTTGKRFFIHQIFGCCTIVKISELLHIKT